MKKDEIKALIFMVLFALVILSLCIGAIYLGMCFGVKHDNETIEIKGGILWKGISRVYGYRKRFGLTTD